MNADEVVYALTHLEPGEDPFKFLSNLIKDRFLPHPSQAAKIQLCLLTVIHGICALLLLVTLGLRWWKNQFWLFRWQLFSLMQPNLMIVPSLAGLTTMVLFEVLIIGSIRVYSAEGNGTPPAYFGYFVLLVGVFPAVVGELVTWSLATSFLVHLHASSGSTPSLARWILFCNVIGASFPIMYLTTFMILDVLAGHSYSEAVIAFRQVDEFLVSQSQQWNPSNSTFTLSSLVPIVPQFQLLESKFVRLTSFWKATYMFHAIVAVALILSLATIATLYLSSVERIIRRARQEMMDYGRGGETLARVQKTWTFLLILLSTFLLLASFSLGLSIYAAVHPLTTPAAYVFTSFWCSGLLSVLCVTLVVWQSWSGENTNENENEGDRTAGGGGGVRNDGRRGGGGGEAARRFEILEEEEGKREVGREGVTMNRPQTRKIGFKLEEGSPNRFERSLPSLPEPQSSKWFNPFDWFRATATNREDHLEGTMRGLNRRGSSTTIGGKGRGVLSSPRVGATSRVREVSIVVEVFSRVDTIEEPIEGVGAGGDFQELEEFKDRLSNGKRWSASGGGGGRNDYL